jgi:hypothetical protein
MAAGIYSGQNTDVLQTQSTMFSTPALNLHSQTDGYLSCELAGASTFLTTAGQPRLPVLIQTLELPFGATDISVSLIPGTVSTQTVTIPIEPSLPLLPLTLAEQSSGITPVKDEAVYGMTTPFPSTWYSLSCGVGLNAENNRVTHATIKFYPVRYTPATGMLLVADGATATITYSMPQSTSSVTSENFSLVIIAPSTFETALQPLVDHKTSHGIATFLKTTEDIYAQYDGVDKPEQIKYFIKDAIETYNITSVMLVGGVKSVFCSKPRDDQNQGSSGWYVPVRYTNLWDNPKFPLASEATLHDPGVISDLYYADIYEVGGNFSSWDVNGDGTFAAWGKPGVENDTGIDMYPDVALGRLACTSVKEVKTLVEKITTYETTAYGTEWFKKMTVVSGDGFLDQEDLNFLWDTTGLADGAYTIHAQSNNTVGEFGPTETINVTINKTQPTAMTFNHDDNLRIHSFPGLPMAEICTISEGNVLGNTDFTYIPTDGEAYCNEFYFWANMSYQAGVLTIRGKSYDPKPYGTFTSIHVWITDSANATVFDDWRNDLAMYYEGEWTTGEQALLGRGGALYYMPEDFVRDIVWTSNGRLTGQEDCIAALNEGAGFVFFSGHGSPNVWADHNPGVPGNRQGGSVTGLQVTTLKPWAPYFSLPIMPMDTLSNGEKLPIAVVGGCHNSQFNVSMVHAFLDSFQFMFPNLPKKYMWCYGTPVPETFSWRLVSNPNGGAIASMGNTGLGYGMPGEDLTTGGGDSWITIEFFRQYGAEGRTVLGQAYQQTLTAYLDTFDMNDLAAGHPKSVQQWVLLGDPTLQIGGYAS